jgi:GeoRSP system PqqD family protein
MRRIQRNPDVLWREEDEQRDQARSALEQGDAAEDIATSLLFNNGIMLSLNILGTEIWKLCDGRTSAEIVTELLTCFEVDEDELRADVTGFLNELAEKGFIHYGK